VNAHAVLKSAAEILRDYRITTASSALGRYYATCPQCSHQRKKPNQLLKCLGVTIDEKGVQFGCNHCGWTGGKFYLENAQPNWQRVVQTPRCCSLPTAADRSARAVALWNSAVEPSRTRVERYLKRRALSLPDNIAGRVARYHEACPWRGDDGTIEYRPAMLTAFRTIEGDRLVAVHRTLISDDGLKLDRRMLGPVAGAAIKIDDDTDVEQGLTICEGFETGLAGRELGYRPVWALGSADAIGQFPVLAGIDALTILAETDDSGANEKARRACGNRWAAADREVLVATPRVVGDMNDALQS
jgi:Toprim domain